MALEGTGLGALSAGEQVPEFVLFIFYRGEEKMSLLKQLANSNYISVNKTLIKTVGLEEAILLGELCSEYDYWDEHNQLTDDGYFYATVEKIEDNTTLSEYQQRKAVNTLKNLDILETKLKGLPAMRYFKINESMLLSFLGASSEKTKELDTEKFKSSNNRDNKNRNKKPLIAKAIKGVPEKSMSDLFIDKYNMICTKLPKCLKVTDKRAKAIKKIMDKYDPFTIEDAFHKANESPFLTGDNDRGWKADIDFILREDKFVSIMEDKYAGKAKRNSVSTEGHLELNRNVDKGKFRKEISSGKAEKF